MKYHPLPSSFCRDVLPTLPPQAQVILFCLLRYSGSEKDKAGKIIQLFKPCWPSRETIGRETGLSKNTVRVHCATLSARGIIDFEVIQHKDYHTYKAHFNLSKYIEQDVREARAKSAANEYTEMVKEIVRPDLEKLAQIIDRQEFDFSKLHSELQQWKDFLQYTGKHGRTHYFSAKPGTVSPAFVESEFKKRGLSIVVKAS